MAVIFVCAYNGENFFPEYIDELDEYDDFHPNWKYTGALNMADGELPTELLTRSGRERMYDGKSADYPHDAEKITFSRHFTLLFNIFVMMQFFNFLNARKIEDEFNIFDGITKNMIFFFVLLIIIVF